MSISSPAPAGPRRSDLPDEDPRDVPRRLAAAGVTAPAGHFYAIEASRHLGLDGRGAVRAGLAPYTNADDVERLLAAL